MSNIQNQRPSYIQIERQTPQYVDNMYNNIQTEQAHTNPRPTNKPTGACIRPCSRDSNKKLHTLITQTSANFTPCKHKRSCKSIHTVIIKLAK